MNVLRDFHCSNCGEDFETWAEAVPYVHCPECNEAATRLTTGGNFMLPGWDVGFPTAADQWARRHRNANKDNLKDLGIPV
jgi:hypothetical protein